MYIGILFNHKRVKFCHFNNIDGPQTDIFSKIKRKTNTK